MKEDWQKVKLGEIATFSNGINFGKESYSSGVKLISVSDFGDRYFPDYNSLVEIDEKVLKESDYLKNGDIVFVRSNGNKELVGRCMMIKNPQYPVTYSGFCIRARLNNLEKFDTKFFLYNFKSRKFRQSIANLSKGTNIQNLNQQILSNYEIDLPPLSIQKKISSILSSYDDLIENNNKQIKLLEETAQKLYKEWFVKLNFPGHENTKILDGVPEGWTVEKIGTKFLTVLGGTPLRQKKEFWENGTIPWINSGKVNEYRILTPSEYITESALEHSATKLLPKHTTVVAITGATLGQISYTEIETCANQSVIGIIDKDDFLSTYIYCFMINNIQIIIKKATGSAQPHINKDILDSTDIVIPSKDIISRFSEISKSIFNDIYILSKQNQDLQVSRDKLLPKLMNQEIEVTA